MEYAKAREIAVALCYKLQPFCEPDMIRIAGSVRRKKPEVKDIEICALLKREDIMNLFQEKSGEYIPEGAITMIDSFGSVTKGRPDGRYMQIALHEGINLDLFLPVKNDFWRQMAIRTGSSEYSHRVIAAGWRKLGWVGTNNGLRKSDQCYEKKSADGKSSIWMCTNPNPELPPEWKSEEEFFEWLNVEFLEPEKRI